LSQLDLPDRCRVAIEAKEGDGTDYYTVCCRPAQHPHGHMSAAVDDRKKAKRAANKKKENQS
jgi:hypothetical protein